MSKYECGYCLTMFDEHSGGTDMCPLCCSKTLGIVDNTFVHDDDYALEVETDYSLQRLCRSLKLLSFSFSEEDKREFFKGLKTIRDYSID